jgi:hypothetical protein
LLRQPKLERRCVTRATPEQTRALVPHPAIG